MAISKPTISADTLEWIWEFTNAAVAFQHCLYLEDCSKDSLELAKAHLSSLSKQDDDPVSLYEAERSVAIVTGQLATSRDQSAFTRKKYEAIAQELESREISTSVLLQALKINIPTV